MERLHPGVYVEEISSGIRPIEGVGTSTTAFVGVAARGVPDQAQFITSYDEYTRYFGGVLPDEDGFLPLSVKAFFDAGGVRAYVVRTLPSTSTLGVQVGAQATRFAPAAGTAAPALSFQARGAGSWSASIRIAISDATNFPDRAFRVEVYSVEAGQTRRLEVFDDLSMDPDSDEYFAPLINEASRYVRVTDEWQAALAADDGSFVPVPESLPSVQARSLGAEDAYVAHEGASLAFSWKTTGGETHTQTLTFEGAGLAFQDGVAELDAAALLTFLNDAFEANEGGAIFRARAGVGDAGPIVEPNVATRGRLTIAAPANGTLDLSGETLNFTIGGAPAISIVVADEFANPAAVSQSQLVEVLSARLGAANLVEPRGDEVIIRTRAVADGAAPAFSQAPGTNGLTVASLAGSEGLVLETPEGVTLVVSEEPNRHFPRTLRDIGFASRAEGYEQDSPKNPLVRPRATTDMIRLLGGTDGTGPVTSADFDRALTVLDRVEFQLLAFPGRTGTAFINAGLGYCDRRGDCFFIADGPGHVDPNLAVSPGDARSFVDALPNRSNNGAMYYPWLLVPDPVGAGRNPRRFVPPSGHIAGIFARTDNRRGVWKAPAGIEAAVTGAIGLQWQLIDSEQDILNPVGLNAIRQFPGAGIVCWGSRTLASDPEWRYVPVRRLALFLKSSLQRGLQWAVFEPNDAELWGRIQVNITAFMLSLFGQGAFQGSTPEDAFNVLCDRSTNPQELIDAGIVTARVAFAPLKPAEFVVIQIVQKTLVEG